VTVIDSDQHLYEPDGMWADFADPQARELALRYEEDELGYTHIVWRGGPLGLADVQFPGRTAELGERRARFRRGEPCDQRFAEALPDDYWSPTARAARVRAMGFDAAVCFPNFGLLWERRLSGSPADLLANMGAWNRWCAEVVVPEGGGVVHPVAHLTLRDLDWLESQLAMLSRAGVRLAMVAPALVDGKPLSHPSLDRAWSAFEHHGVTPVFHVADQPRVFDDAWYTDDGTAFVNVLESVFLWTPPALALADLILNGVLERHARLRIGVVELSAHWVPQFCMMLDGGWDFTAKLNGSVPAELSMRPSEYLRRQVRVSAFAYELPGRLARQAGDLFMCCSDYPHSEGTATPLDDYARNGDDPASAPGLFGANVSTLLA
jgi:predicted TIM-barrel fold metal-dependent hydrolase